MLYKTRSFIAQNLKGKMQKVKSMCYTSNGSSGYGYVSVYYKQIV